MGTMEYKPGQTGNRLHQGQRKLLLSEIEFLTKYVHDHDNDHRQKRRTIVVYAGAADGYHIPLLATLFPQVSEWHLWDPAPFAENVVRWKNAHQATERVQLYNHCFTDKVAKWYNHRNRDDDILFICDIRSNAYNDNIIMEEMKAQYKWSQIMNSRVNMVKFRLPFPTSTTSVFTYVKGHIYLQVYAPLNSTECRCIYKRGATEMVDYDLKLHEERMAWFNNVMREKRAYDSSAERFILACYIDRFHKPQGMNVDELLNIIDKHMNARGCVTNRQTKKSVTF